MPSYKNKWLLFERFKMALFEDELRDHDYTNGNSSTSKKYKSKTSPKKKRKIGIADTLSAANGQRYGSDFVFVSAFKHIQSEALKFMHKKLKLDNIQNEDIQWIITVPAIWSDRAKHKMTSWAIAAGLVSKKIRNQLKIVYEPDCASLAIQHQMRNRRKSKTHGLQLDDVKENDAGFMIGDQYVLLDVGGGTADICCHEIVGEFGVREVLAPSGGPWGSSLIDDEYAQLLQNIFSAAWMQKCRRLLPNVYVECIENFQRAKMFFFRNKRSNKWYNVGLPREFCEFLSEEIEALQDDEMQEIEDLVQRTKFAGFSSLLRFEDDVLSLDVSIWRAMFDAVIDRIILHVSNLLSDAKMRKCKYLVEGAAYFGLTANYIQSRILKKTYGIKASFTETKAKANGLSAQQIDANKIFIDYYHGYFVKNCFKVLGRKNSEIVQNQVVKYCCKRQPGCAMAKIAIICSDMECPKLVSDGQV
eukprot:CAMPEP_0202731308 /NCGR_PEP_ID=MMETSP1385-20130828/187081_1 /ASSEMBLY_ACC=CAM_ASM_000861 /TAXON_ID=933848 /ORGANISM="Elphidium margaritaceum" /LENGTH=472 /DNA_ID=CAMNT_0049397601 /DNA_START=121 /DNA_END=1536 /DNA_ORIENTATION=+